NMEKTMLDLVKFCHHKQFLFMHDNVNDLIESALDSKLLSINSINSQRLDKTEQEVKSVEEQPAERKNQEADLFLDDNPIPSGIENFADDPERDIRFLEELLTDDSILSHKSSDSNFEDNPLIPRPPPKPPDAETNIEEEIAAVMIDNDDSQFFMFDKEFSLLSAESEDTIFDPDKESLENPFNEIADNESDLELEATIDTTLSSTEDIYHLAVEEPPQDSNTHQLIEECFVEVPEEQKQNMEKTMLDLEQEIKIVEEQPAERRNRIEKSLHEDEESLKMLSIVSVEEENVVQREEEDVELEDISQVQDFVLREKLFSITHLIFNIESLNDNSTPDRVLISFESDNSLLDDF
nr:hypothetical protein [Tanacetum cinerariifolium]